jgi:mannose-6-phosphate isomerase-like protein (cupin superfamily)
MRVCEVNRVAVALLLGVSGCRHTPSGTIAMGRAQAVPPTPLVLEEQQGERRVRRSEAGGQIAPASIIKVDRQNGGSQDLVLGFEDLAPGRTISAHRHLLADEIILVRAGAGMVELGERQTPFGPGATIYIPKNVRVSVHNTGSVPLAIAFIFSKPGFEAYMRDTSVPEGEPVTPMSRAELAAIRSRHQSHTVYEQP